ncbi:dihydrolipoamide acetyltransferase family protein [Leucobacter sp. UT-8R-CII-1-4]|uniref:dihydrolipoamide acetyltransferase family protein n=1 Tax=Leucobacter sp. UT-8R-CII-1-4 TaxID=3040075 RepID=UPI0024A7DFA4|nr:dihydrolipoamide acetyltransferase family protein [Leucobacter sp. UT-8R-CII-1-4]MDI6023513.1 dihydrolipoamide acetyltransferase family protein [Leucobacter sp. UT-8R-CII-1-4]
MSEQTFPLPDVGEGLTEAEIVNWLVKPGDTVALNQVVCEIETAKSLVELPSPFEGVVTELLAEVGQTVPVGNAILRIRSEGDAVDLPAGDTAAVAETPLPATDDRPTGATGASDSLPADEGGAVLVGYGTVAPAKSRRRGKSAPAAAETPAASNGNVIAKPPIRKLAKDLGVDLRDLVGTGQGGEILREDVLRATARDGLFREASKPQTLEAREQRFPVKGVRKVIAENMVASKFQAPHVSVFVDVDATRTMEFVKRLKQSSQFEGVKVSPLLIFAKALLWAVRRNPEVNAQWTDDEIIVKNYVNLGIAAATPRGLVVPNIKEAQDMSLIELAQAIQQLTETARLGRTQPAEMQHGTITITNFGVFGMDFGTPILNRDEVAILAMGSIKQKPWVVEGQVLSRWVTTVGGSFDHRVVDGDVVSRFVADVASVLEEPALLLD